MSVTPTRSFARALCALVFVIAPLVAPGAARAQDDPTDGTGKREFRFDFGAFGGWHFYTDDHGLGRRRDDPTTISPADAPVFGARLALAFNPWVSLEIEGMGSPTRTVSDETNLTVFGYRANLLVHLVDTHAFRPFLLAGYGGLTSVSNDDRVVQGDTDGFFHAGLGFKIGFGDRTGLRIEGRVMAPGAILGSVLPIGDELGYGGPDFEILGGLFINFGEVTNRVIVKKEVTVVTPQDPDGDGISGNADRCPDVAEDRDGFQDEDGCPDADNDADGIPDPRDKCPMEPEDKDGFQDEDGCPDPDNDNDGVPDGRDKCPTESEDKDGFQDDDGCPDPDNDNDGVPDARDKCPAEAETKNQYQDEDGCPDEVPVAVKRFTGIIEGINFKTNSAEILTGSYAILDRAVKVLQDYPDVNLEISGHTDSRGRPDYNRDLSQRRADAVKNYFVGRGIKQERLTSIGYGLTRPIADNATATGRAKNRRTEFRLINPGER
jgi:outer membrane protein OmpA-like peptidoglycan-associated protein